MNEHELKIWPKYFEQVYSGNKTFEIRKNDRNYQVNDVLNLQEYDPETELYTGYDIMVEVTYILDDETYLQPEYVCMGIRLLF